MADGRPLSTHRVPTLTDVLHPTDGSSVLVDAPADAPADTSADKPADTSTDPASDDSALAAALLASIQDRIDPMFQARLREAIAPALARAVDGLLRELGPELALALRETAERAVAQELARRRRTP